MYIKYKTIDAVDEVKTAKVKNYGSDQNDPIVLILLLSAIQANVPVSLFELDSFTQKGNNMHIRLMSLNDYDQVYQLWLSCAGMGLNDLDDSKEGIERFLKRNPDTCFVVEECESIVGVIICGNDGRRGYIYHTAVASNYRNKGIATVLVEKVIQVLKDLGINKVALVVFSKNTGGNAFWEKIGFPKREDLIYRNKTIVEMVRIDT